MTPRARERASLADTVLELACGGTELQILASVEEEWGKCTLGQVRRWTPFRATCEELLRRVRCAGPDGVTIKDAIATKHHYASVAGARSSLATWVREGRLVGVRLEAGRLYATETAP